MANSLKTVIFLGALTGLILFIGGLFGGQNGMIMALVFAGVMNFGAYWFSDRIALAMHRAQEISPSDDPTLHRMVEDLSRQAGIPKPRLYLIPQHAPNAFATGRGPGHAAVAVTGGLLELLSPEEVKGVLAHELAHVKNRDTLIQTVAATVAGAIMVLANMARWSLFWVGSSRDDEDGGGIGGIAGLLLTAILAPIAATLIQMAISRTREYLADASAARIVGSPHGLAGALEKLEYGSRRVPLHTQPAAESMFIVSPLSGQSVFRLFSTHPPIEERVRRLRGMKSSEYERLGNW